ncbi:cryptochrome/photolyase family protein [Aquimonas sp.]|uniref:cryptochrome/photolyase family protein n=1 Tax=Aquimonas sp. TaxID=1872588 RepID=UPI0037BE2104
MQLPTPRTLRRLILVLGDQLDRDSAVFDEFDPAQDAVWMAEVAEESTHVWSHKARIAVFLAGMRHFAADQRAHGRCVLYRQLDAHGAPDLASALREDVAALEPRELVWVRPGDWRVWQSLLGVAQVAGVAVLERPDRHFLCSIDDYAGWAAGKKELRLEFFYRWMRQRLDLLMDGKQPAGGQWNFDADNRDSFDARGPGLLPAPQRFQPDPITREVLALVESRFASHPGALADFDWPLTPAQAETALVDFIDQRLLLFGRYQDAMWTQQPWLYHSRLSVALNLKLITPKRVIDAAIDAWQAGRAPLAAVEGFVRQILGWREYVRGLYWLRMPGYLDDNALGAEQPLPAFYWSGDTDMACLKDAIGQTLRYGYAHHIQRLMVTGLFALMLGVRPREVHEWYLAIYVDAVEWVELPNVLGMSQFADGGVMASKPYCASGKYIQRMGNYCSGCRYKPELAVGPKACPFTTLYWDFLQRHQARFAKHPRAALQWRSLERLSAEQRAAIAEQAQQLREVFAADSAAAASLSVEAARG